MNRFTKKIIALALAGCTALSLAACSSTSSVDPADYAEITCIPEYRFNVPAELHESAASYRDLMVSMAGADYSIYDSAVANEMSYQNIYQLIDFEGRITCALYCPDSSFELSTLSDTNLKDTVIALIDELAFQIDSSADEPTYFGIDTSTELFKNMSFDTDQAVFSDEEGVQEYTVPLTTSYSVEISDTSEEETEDPAPTVVQNVDIGGYLKMITPDGKPTRIMVAYGDDEMQKTYSMKWMVDSFVYDSSVTGSEIIFDAEEVNDINTEMTGAMNEAMEKMLNEENADSESESVANGE